MVLSDPWDAFIYIIALHQVKKLQGINQMVLNETWLDSLEIFSLLPVIKITRD